MSAISVSARPCACNTPTGVSVSNFEVDGDGSFEVDRDPSIFQIDLAEVAK